MANLWVIFHATTFGRYRKMARAPNYPLFDKGSLTPVDLWNRMTELNEMIGTYEDATLSC
jgi:hypothetical protein